MNSRVSPAPGLMRPLSRASVSGVRTTVVPTAHPRRRGPTSRLASLIDDAGRLLAPPVRLGVHRMVRQVFRLDRLEGTGADVQIQLGERDAGGARSEEHPSELQSLD